MKCTEVIKILNGEIDIEKRIRETPTLSAQVKECKKCARALQTLLLAQRYLKDFKSPESRPDIAAAVMRSLPQIRERIEAKRRLFRRMLAEVIINICIYFCFIAAMFWSYKSGMLMTLFDQARPWLVARYRTFADSIPVEAIMNSIVAVLPAAGAIAVAYVLSELLFVYWERKKARGKA